MDNKVNVIIEIRLQRDEENGDVAAFAFDLPKGVAERVCLEQEKCELLCEGGALSRLLNAYALLNGYECAWFISARMSEYSSYVMISGLRKSEILKGVRCHVEECDCADCPYKNHEDCVADMTKDALFVMELQERNISNLENSIRAHNIAGTLFEKRNAFLEDELEKYKKKCETATFDAVRRMQAELKAVKVHFDGVSLKAVPFGCIDAAAEKVIAEVIGGK